MRHHVKTPLSLSPTLSTQHFPRKLSSSPASASSPRYSLSAPFYHCASFSCRWVSFILPDLRLCPFPNCCYPLDCAHWTASSSLLLALPSNSVSLSLGIPVFPLCFAPALHCLSASALPMLVLLGHTATISRILTETLQICLDQCTHEGIRSDPQEIIPQCFQSLNVHNSLVTSPPDSPFLRDIGRVRPYKKS